MKSTWPYAIQPAKYYAKTEASASKDPACLFRAIVRQVFGRLLFPARGLDRENRFKVATRGIIVWFFFFFKGGG